MTMTGEKQNGEKTWHDEHWERHAFHGELEFDLAMEFLGRRDTKKCKVVYAYTRVTGPTST
jgi:hypothetical protein